jgi:hypothetical protein
MKYFYHLSIAFFAQILTLIASTHALEAKTEEELK